MTMLIQLITVVLIIHASHTDTNANTSMIIMILILIVIRSLPAGHRRPLRQGAEEGRETPPWSAARGGYYDMIYTMLWLYYNMICYITY